METSDDILLSAAALADGESVRIQCPTCRRREKTLGITRNESGIVWNCFRAACDEKGGRGGRGGSGGVSKHPQAPAFTPYQGETRACTQAELAFLSEKIGWMQSHCDLARPRWAVGEDRYAFPIYGPAQVRRGFVLRSWTDTWTKALTMMECDEPHMSWYARFPMGQTVIVEDIPSAVRAAKYHNAVALCGTSCGMDYALELAMRVRNVVWMLDADATLNAVKLHRQHMPLFEGSKVVPIECDLKDMPELELGKIMEAL